MWAETRVEFQKYHQNVLNVLLHLVTTPLGIFAVFVAFQRVFPDYVLGALVAIYQLSLVRHLPLPLWSLNGLLLAGLMVAAQRLTLSLTYAFVLLGVSYVGQDLSHWISNEKTFQSSYSGNGLQAFMNMYRLHVYFLLPLVLDAVLSVTFVGRFLSCLVAHDDVLCAKLTEAPQRRDLEVMRQWVLRQNPTKEHTTHWWFHTLPEAERATFDRLAKCQPMMDVFQQRFGSSYGVDVVEGMNEVYVAALKHSMNSDTVFYTNHCDGPFMLFPHAYLFRTILAVNPNVQVRTVFPSLPAQMTMSTGDALGFDFNREVHRIETIPGQTNTEPRIVLKIHYVVYPKALPWYGRWYAWLNITYDVWARKAFLKTLTPSSVFEQVFARLIILATLYRYLELCVGHANIMLLSTLGALSALVDARIWLVSTSFVHYLMYIATYYHRQRISFHNFKRDVILYKALALINLWWLYLSSASSGVSLSLSLVLSLVLLGVGNALAILATRALGTDRTYFGVELGLCEPKRVTAFPYNLPIPHPMIIGGIIGLLGFHAMDSFRAQWPWLVPVHVVCYLVHMAQEHWDVHAGSKSATSTVRSVPRILSSVAS